MPRQPSKYKSVIDSIPEFIQTLKEAKTEAEIAKVCQSMKDSIDKASGKTVGRRDPKTMGAIRGAVTEFFPSIPVDPETHADFPYYLTDSKVGKVTRLEHLAHKYLIDDRNQKEGDLNDELKQQSAKIEPEEKTVKASEMSLEAFGLSSDEIEVIKRALGDADIKEWVKQAMLQRANAINSLRNRQDEDLSMVSSQELMENKKYRTNSKASRELTSRAVRAIKKYNANSPEYRWCITNALISEITGITPKAIAKAVEGMGIEDYNKMMGLQTINNRLTKAKIGEIKDVINIKDVSGVDE